MDAQSLPDFRALAMNRDLTWADVSGIKWGDVPVTGDSEHVFYSRTVAGMARDFDEHYASENRAYAIALDEWLTRYSAEHTHPDLRT